jgi:hypothetical protein
LRKLLDILSYPNEHQTWHFHNTNKSFPYFLSSYHPFPPKVQRKQITNQANNFCMIDYEKHLIFWAHEVTLLKCFYFLAWVPDSKCHSKKTFSWYIYILFHILPLFINLFFKTIAYVFQAFLQITVEYIKIGKYTTI